MARILIIGAGVVGTATGIGLIEHDNDVTFVDINHERIHALREQGRKAISPDLINLDGVDAVFVSVTALTSESDGIDLQHLLEATHNLASALSYCQTKPVIVYRCTLPPGTVRGKLIPLLEEISGKKAGTDFGVVYNPEFLRAATALEDFLVPRIVVLASAERGSWEHQTVERILHEFAPTHWLTLEQAELLKYVNNVFNANKITFFNMMRFFASKNGIDDVEKVLELAVLSAEGLYDPFYGTRDKGPYGGVCLPKDTEALRFLFEKHGMDEFATLLSSVQNVNRLMGGTR